MTIRSRLNVRRCPVSIGPGMAFYLSSADIGARRAKVGKRVLVFAAVILAFVAFARPARANVDSPQGALDVAGIVPGKYAFMDRTKTPIGPAEATVSSVKAIVGLMKQAIDVAAILPQDMPAAPAVQPSVFVPMTDVDIALKVAAMTPKFDAERQNARVSKLLESRGLLWPVEGFIFSAFNATRGGGRLHGAVDIVTSKNTPIASAADGVVAVVVNGGKKLNGYGKMVIVDHGDGVSTLYSHCNSILVKMGQKVKRGDFIATVGKTGRATTDHVHFEVRVAGKKQDPLRYLPERPELVKARNWKSKKS